MPVRKSEAPEIGGQGASLSATPSFSRTAWLADILRERILKGIYKPGDRIVEIALQREFDFSNGPVREALHQLVAEGIAERAPWRGVRVAQLTAAEIADLFHLRLALLEYAAELAARNNSSIDRKEALQLKKVLRTALFGVKSGSLQLMNGELLQWVLKVAGNKPLQDTWNRTMLRTRVYVYAAMLRTGAKSEPIQYRIIDAILAGDVETARNTVRELTRQTLIDLGIETSI